MSSKCFQALSTFFSRRSRVSPGVVSLGVCALLTGCGAALLSEESGEAASLKAQSSALYVSSSVVWTTKNIPVCWENGSSADTDQRNWVRSAVTSTWDVNSEVDFTGWGSCGSSSTGIRIKISDERPRAQRYGKDLDKFRDGVILNFTFQNWGIPCQNKKEECIRNTAVHEFGHALGFAHEQNRPDTPSSCTDQPQGGDGDVIIGAWDLDSVMNYCNPKWNGDGKLSATDLLGLQTVYGKSTDVGIIPDTLACPDNSERISIYMDDEDNHNASSFWGWKGATESTTNTRFYLCRVRGDPFKPLTSKNDERRNYAVLKLGQECPSGATEFRRFFDNENDNNTNSWSAPWSSSISPNISSRNTLLTFCLFTTGAQTMQGFPSLGISYGVFAADNLRGALDTGGVHTDDEDSDNSNAYDAVYYEIASRIVSTGDNTDIHMARVQ